MACSARAFDDSADQPQPADRLNPPPHAAKDNAVLVPRRAGTAACDLLGRITRRAEAGLNATWTYATAVTTTYQSLSGKVATIAYPSGLSIQYAYNAYGYLYQMQNRGSGVVSWTVNARDQYLHAVSGTAGNGVVTTHTYNARTGRVSGIQAGTGNAVANFEIR